MIRKMVSVLVVSGLVVGMSVNVFGYTFTKVGFYNKYCEVKNELPSGYSGELATAIRAWNATDSPQKHYTNNNSGNRVYTTYSKLSYPARYETRCEDPEYPKHQCTNFAIKVNTRIYPNCTGTTAIKVRSSISHELGHAIGLYHSTKTAVMNVDRDRSKIYSPQKDDIDGSIASWKR